MNDQIQTVVRSSSGLEPNAAGALCYVFGFLSGILFLATDRRACRVMDAVKEHELVIHGVVSRTPVSRTGE